MGHREKYYVDGTILDKKDIYLFGCKYTYCKASLYLKATSNTIIEKIWQEQPL